jgi:hypothetical protein
MKISQPDVVSNLLNTNQDRFNKNKVGNTDGQQGQTSSLEDLYESSFLKGDAAYTNPALDVNSMAVQQLMNENDDIQGTVNQLITDLLKRQGYSEEQIKAGDFDNVSIDEIAREEAARLIGPGGELSPEKVSDRIVNFAIAAFGGDTSKIDIIRDAIDRGFGEAEQILGELADVSKETYELIQDKLDSWVEGAEEGQTVEENGEQSE